ncbi:ATP-dependent DNA helicase q4-like [Plakobranchus ocellatus]|uniref:ATP-dependent DNA helicase q4-like n=1 Tax=Plakobranchus ocellatus TaxID=259542 RepID=A0AAV3XX20_9GAST|nr:ATP-dependent DNA helicase q4-like [Plakobranchus ocellatus]
MSETTDELRKVLKKWEAAFVIVHQRKPNKEDIANAPQDIKDKYRLYHESKKGSQQIRKSSDDSSETENIEVWSVKLNRKPHTNPTDSKTPKDNGAQGLLDKMGAKLFQQSVAASHSQNSRKITQPGKKSRGLSSQGKNAEQVFSSDLSLQDKARGMASSKLSEVTPKADDCTDGEQDTVETNSYKEADEADLVLKGTIFNTAEKFLKNTPSGLSVQRKHSITSKSRMSFLSRDFTHVKAKKYEREDEIDGNLQEPSEGLAEQRLCPGDPSDAKVQFDLTRDFSSATHAIASASCDYIPNKVIDGTQSLETLQAGGLPHRQRPSKISPSCTLNNENAYEKKSHIQKISHSTDDSLNSFDTFEYELEKNPRMEKEIINCDSQIKFSAGSKVDTESDKLHVPTSGSKQENAVTKESRKRKIQLLDEDFSAGMDTESFNKDEFDDVQDKAENQMKTVPPRGVGPKKAPAVKKNAASLNENYVCLNMKKKGYRRKGGAGLTSAQLRKKQWKQKMSARSQSFGTNKCFKCGQEGHWANKCKGKAVKTPSFSRPNSYSDPGPAGDNNSQTVEESDFPSLRQAALMARGTGKDTEEEGLDGADIADIEASIVRDRWNDCAGSDTQTSATETPLASTLKGDFYSLVLCST